IRECIPLHLENHELTSDQAKATMKEIMSGEATSSQVAAFLIGLKKKQETADEVTALAQVMREFSRRIHPKINGYLLDTCGTGGDRTKTFNVSTTAAFVIAAAGVPVAKHGNRSFTSKCGSADVLEQLGLNLNRAAQLVERAIEEISMTGKTIIVRRQHGRVFRDEVEPEDLGFKRSTAEEVAGSDPEENAGLTAKILSGHLGRNDPRVQMVLANAAAGLVLCERAENFREGVEIASKVVSDGKPFQTLYQLVEFSGGDTHRLKNLA